VSIEQSASRGFQIEEQLLSVVGRDFQLRSGGGLQLILGRER
jgi:hypothetical protein